jgi:hypothetical protein
MLGSEASEGVRIGAPSFVITNATDFAGVVLLAAPYLYDGFFRN